MRVGPGAGTHLTYCTNIHPGETWPEVRDAVAKHTVAVKRRISPNAPFGLGLRLSAGAATALAAPRELAEFRALLAEEGLYVFTINGFPFGDFHGTRVKEQVYRPDWSEPLRITYSNTLADVLAALLPSGVEGSISTVPVGFAPRFASATAKSEAVRGLLAHAMHLHRVRDQRGVTIGLALEPEPGCVLETTRDAVLYFESTLLRRETLAGHARSLGCSVTDAESSLRRHLGLCIDTCHAAVEFESATESLDEVERAELRVLKLQLTAGLRVDPGALDALASLRAFADDVYLHQVVARRGEGYERRLDLPAALDELAPSLRPGEEWRVHFHVPLYLEALSPLGGTHGFVEAVLARQKRRPVSTHLEVETYTWSVLPERHRTADVDDGIARELRWVAERLAT
jgi:sugar phosphate isomerase/epimerase